MGYDAIHFRLWYRMNENKRKEGLLSDQRGTIVQKERDGDGPNESDVYDVGKETLQWARVYTIHVECK